MHLLQNLKQKSVARKSMILLAAITLSAAVATNALAAGDGGGGGLGGGGGFGGSHIGGGGGFAAGHIGGDRDHDRDHHFRDRFVVVPGYDGYYDAPSYPYDDSYSTPQVVVPEPSGPACQHSEQTVKVPSENGGTAQVTILRC